MNLTLRRELESTDLRLGSDKKAQSLQDMFSHAAHGHVDLPLLALHSPTRKRHLQSANLAITKSRSVRNRADPRKSRW